MSKFFYRLLTLLLLIIFTPLTLLLFLRELGRLVVAKVCRAKVFTFSFGFGKEVWRKNVRGIELSLRMIPLGSYLKMDSLPESRFQELAFWKKITITLAGPATLLGFAIVISLFTQIYFGQDSPSSKPVIGAAFPNYPASNAGLQAGDRIISINESPVSDWSTITTLVTEFGKEELTLQVERHSTVQEFKLLPYYDDLSDRLVIGIAPQSKIVRTTFAEALKRSPGEIKEHAAHWLGYLSQEVTREPIVIFSDYGQTIDSEGLQSARYSPLEFSVLLFSWALLHLTVLFFLITLIPVPYLFDGGHCLFYCFEALKGSSSKHNYTFWANRLGLFVVPLLILWFLMKEFF